jgi:hypothetical protein
MILGILLELSHLCPEFLVLLVLLGLQDLLSSIGLNDLGLQLGF